MAQAGASAVPWGLTFVLRLPAGNAAGHAPEYWRCYTDVE
jgi:hypothetical protein